MYTRLLKQVTDPQVRKVMEQLQSASRERHLPAFRRAVELHSAPGARR
jgi:rubrerythrin